MDALPQWPDKTVAVLATAGAAPHAIPVSTAVRRGPRELAFALALPRTSLRRLRAEPACAIVILAAGISVTVHGRATVERELERFAVVRVDVDSIQDHASPRFEIDAGVAWHWTSPEAAESDAGTRSALLGGEDDQLGDVDVRGG
jgi:flavin reductase (DIM6/NTAB) family NADH-FMN oxidoreductase RutF